jgi:pectinesterase
MGGVNSNGGSQTLGGAGGKGGASSGGSANGGGGAGGANGGAAAGGKSATGGTSTGGTSTGGTGTGGASTGGKSSTGGTSTGGTTAGDPALCPPGITQTITVAKDGSGQFSTVQAAVNSITSGSSAHIRIDIKAGTYTEKLTIASRTNLCLVGAGATSTILSYNDSNGSVGSTSGSASVLISANDFSAANLTIQNSFGSGSQAVALRTTGQRQQFLNCRFVGYQDTLYTHQGMQYFRNCYVQGNTDYVFGGATAVLQNCEVRNVEGGSAVAAPNTDAGTAYGIVFLGGKFTAASGVKANSVGLGRPWGASGFGAYLNIDLGAHIIAAGFVEMSGNQPQNARFHEYQSTGSGANAGSRSSYQLSASQAVSYTLGTILAGWTPSYSQ